MKKVLNKSCSKTHYWVQSDLSQNWGQIIYVEAAEQALGFKHCAPLLGWRYLQLRCTAILLFSFYDIIFSAVNDMSDTASSCSGRSSCCTEASYHCTSWRGTLSTSWQSLASTNSTLMLPSISGGGTGGSNNVKLVKARDCQEVERVPLRDVRRQLASVHQQLRPEQLLDFVLQKFLEDVLQKFLGIRDELSFNLFSC